MNDITFLRRYAAAFAVSACALGASAATDFEISFADGAGAFPLVGAEIYVPADRAVTATVADMFAGDVEAVSGLRPAIVKKAGKKPLVVIGTASNAKVKALAAKAGVDLSVAYQNLHRGSDAKARHGLDVVRMVEGELGITHGTGPEIAYVVGLV